MLSPDGSSGGGGGGGGGGGKPDKVRRHLLRGNRVVVEVVAATVGTL